MTIQMAAAKKWRQDVLGENESGGGNDSARNFDAATFPPFVACQTDTVPTINQILRRRRKSTSETQAKLTRKGRNPVNPWEYDYISGRSVPGDGRIDYDKAFPPLISHKRVTLDSAHAKQMCWEESGGSLGRVYAEVVEQAEEYFKRLEEKERMVGADLELVQEEEILEKKNKSMIKRITGRARNVRNRLRRRRLVKPGVASSDLVGPDGVRRFSFRRRRR